MMVMDGSETPDGTEAYTKYELTLADAYEARPLSLLHFPKTLEALALVEAVTAQVAAQEQRKRPRGAGETGKLQEAVGAVLGGVLTVAWKAEGLVYRSMNKNSFVGEVVAYRQAEAALNGLEALGLIRRYSGVRYEWGAELDGPARWEGIAARFGATEALKTLAASHGIAQDNVGAAFDIRWPVRPPKIRASVILRPLASRLPGERAKRGNATIPLDMEDAKVRKLVDEVEAANAVLAKHSFEGCTPPALYRAFRGDFGLGGRWITAGTMSIQQMSAAARLKIRIDDHPVVEVDVKASQLSILAACAGVKELTFDDPYSFPDAPWNRLPNAREIVKSLVVAALGAGKLPTRWPNGMKGRLGVPNSVRLGDITEALAARFPFLKQPHAVLGVAPEVVALRLQALEADAITAALGHAWGRDIPAVPVHDSIIVPQAAARMVEADLRMAYRVRCNGAIVRTVSSVSV
ncbi:hypothetical protein [Acidocella sp. KAb 2-4]|uniref:hypothetical protein n=1 Tax=Acidocella sp. KAb 2-4 TaxID=2885158 RepID=UPI001D07BA12|nr:hypothetical protein [Acidocella sp. KAb 2-4]MCB5945841.1 hypothetical protein [Acidocella sp. KAb 2-4]